MLWIKRNLFLVVGGLLALGLLGLGGFYFYSNYDENKSLESKIDEAKADLKRLYGLSPFPSRTNIDLAKAEIQRLKGALAETKKGFSPLPYERVKGPAFKSLLDLTIDELQRKAAQAGVGLPLSNGYAFTFAEQQKRLQFSEGSFPTISEQLAEIKAISSILFSAKINKLTGLRRGRVTTDDPPAASDYHEMSPNRTLPSGAVVSPYVAEFTSFSTELAGVLEGFYKSPNGLLVKGVEVKPIEEVQVPGGAPPPNTPPPPVLAPAPGAPTNYLRRPVPTTSAPGATPVPRPRPPGSAAGTQPAVGGPGEILKTVLDEKILRVTLWIDVLKPAAK
jgi:hypothetical protein